MAASDTFQRFIASLSVKEQEQLKGVLARTREDLFAARSEEARVRIVDSLIHEAHSYAVTGRR